MADTKVYIGDRSQEGAPQKLVVQLNGENIELDYTGKDAIVETLLSAGYNPPYSCLDGACMACIAKVEEGCVYQNDPGILTDDNMRDKDILSCQARPCSPRVKINYDSI